MSFGISKAGAYCKGVVSVIRGFGGVAKVGPQGYGRIIVHDKDGNFKTDTGWVKNNFVDDGKAYCATKVSGVTAPAAMDYLAVGTGQGAENDTDSLLGAEIQTNGLTKAQDGTPAVSTTTVTDDTMEISYSWSVTGTSTIWEIGVFNATGFETGTLLGRTKLGTSVTVNDGDTCNGLYKVIFA